MRRRHARRVALRTLRWLGLAVLEVALLATVALLPGLFFWRILTGSSADAATFPLGDFTELHFPYRHWAAEELGRGRIPSWNPYVSAGHPSLGDIQFGLLYPIGRWIAERGGGDLTVLQLEQQVVLHFSIAAVGTYLFARVVGAGRAGALLAGLVFAFGGYMTTFPVQQIIILQTSVWLPWIVLGIELAIGRRIPIAGALVAAGTLMAALVGHPQTLGYVLLLATAYGLYRLWTRPSLDGLVSSAIGGMLGLALAAPALLTALEHLRLTARTDVGYAFTAHGFTPHELLGLVLPTDLGGRSLYVGVPVLALALLAAAERRRHCGFWATALAVALVLSLGGNTFLYPAAYALLPGLQFFRDHERAAMLVQFALAVLAGQGLGWLVRAPRAGVRSWLGSGARVTFAIAAALALFGLLLQYAVLTSEGDRRNQLGAFADRAFLTALFAVLGGVLLSAAKRGQASGPAVAVGAIALAGVDLFTAGWTLNLSTGSPEALLRATPTVQFLRTSVGPLDRVASEGVLPADGNVGALFRIPDIVGNSPLDLHAYRVFGDKVDEFQRWRLLSVRFIVTKRKIEDPRLPRVFVENDLNTHELRRDLRLPRAWLVHRAIVASDRDDELELTRRIKPDEEVVLAEPVGALDGRAPDRPVAQGTDVAVVAYESERITLRSWSSRDAVLVLGERDYPGWSATVDGQASPVVRANSVLRAVYVPGGRHDLELRFEPPGLAAGQEIALQAQQVGTWLALVGLLAPPLLWSATRAGGILRRRLAARRRDRTAPVRDVGAGAPNGAIEPAPVPEESRGAR